MATDLIMPTVPGEPHQMAPPPSTFSHLPAQRPQHMRSLSYQVPPQQPSSNQVSPLSTSIERQHTSTPSSPKAYHARQCRPMYMPAVLRPNSDFFPQKLNGALAPDRASTFSSMPEMNSGSFLGMPGISAISQRLVRRTTGDSAKFLEGNWDLDLFPKATSLPTRQHWKADHEATVCDDATCRRNFNYFVRRHHCRRCGNIFCDQHSAFETPLDQDANFNPRAAPSRTCHHCFEQYKNWHSRNSSRTSSTASSDVQGGMPPTPITSIPGGAAITLPKHSEVAASVPRDWNWSTF